ncbi:hypothetical protein K439DRAFT_1664152 [Ramaria rubella]|nr:hypothetical protein K439DRAFT_1664152 [Ramaria rubella]
MWFSALVNHRSISTLHYIFTLSENLSVPAPPPQVTMYHAIFDPPAVKSYLKSCLKGREKKVNSHKNKNSWIVDWQSDWTEAALEKTINRWVGAECVGSKAQMRYTAEVLEYVKILHRALIGHNGQLNYAMQPLPPNFPMYGPVFCPPTVEYANICPPIRADNPFEVSKSIRKRVAESDPAEFLIESVHIINPVFYPDLRLDKCPVGGCMESVEKKGFRATGFRTIYGLECNIKAIGMEYNCLPHKAFSTTSSDKFWTYFKPWQIAGIPHFQHKSGCTRELYDFIVELRPHSSVGQLVENIRQLHILHNRRKEYAWLGQVLREKKSAATKGILPYPSTLQQNSADGVVASEIQINGWPSESTVRAVYEYFIENQRRDESERYSRTLAGEIPLSNWYFVSNASDGLSIGLDATLKIARKANIYVKSHQSDSKHTTVVNIFEGGLLTGEFLHGNSPIEMAAPLQEYAERCGALGVDFKHDGEACVDRCCDFRGSIHAALLQLTVVQDVAHLKNRILDMVSKKTPYRETLGKDITRAIFSAPGDGKGWPAQFRTKEAQVENLE